MFSQVRLKDLVHWTNAKTPTVFPSDTLVTDIGTDSRSLKKGSVFVAIRGERYDGHQFVLEALKKGASAALVETRLPEWPSSLPVMAVPRSVRAMAEVGSALRQRFQGPVFAVTGSAGKSSTKNMLASLLGPHTVASPKSFNNLQGVSQTLFLVEDSTEKLVLEMGMNARGEISEMCHYFRPSFALITNIGTAHIGRLGGQEQIYLAKKELFDSIASATPSDQLRAVAINVDDKFVVRAAKDLPKEVRRITYSACGAGADVRILQKSLSPNTGALQVELMFGGKRSVHELPVFGLHQAENLAAAVAGAVLLGESTEAIRQRLSKVRSGEHRGEMFSSPRGVTVIDEAYNSNPNALISSMQSAFEMKPGARRVLVLGEMRELDSFSDTLHQEAAEALVGLYRSKKGAPFVLLGVGERFTPFLEHIRRSLPEIECHDSPDAQDAIKKLDSVLADGDLVLVKGSRGIQLDQVVDWLRLKA